MVNVILMYTDLIRITGDAGAAALVDVNRRYVSRWTGVCGIDAAAHTFEGITALRGLPGKPFIRRAAGTP